LARGRVDWYSPYLRYGFIVPQDGGTKAFVRREDLASGEEDLENNEEVTYEGAEGPEARNVSRVRSLGPAQLFPYGSGC
jgi:cold shock CspA family protein